MKYVRIPKKIKELTDRIIATYQPEKVILFGSYAWGKPRTDSDFDLCVIKTSVEPRRERQLRLRKLLLGFDAAADILAFTPE
ncbi:MAG: nucleotidyltransferase domain-containing protein, partial [Parcubacteria group bacterium]|nr:nucleotidyltransferase domain-containing protein [Parcubacteria group bacterium]